MTAQLPQPGRHRWQPLRAGLVDLFLYDSEEFWFRDGHLLLRGNNGTGKSKVLALLLPFLLDGEIAAHRVEPDGDPGKRMEWNLLLGGKYKDRLGYTWLEFGRLDDDGTPRFLTIGCGMKAVEGRGVGARWYFTTDLRPGSELSLIGPGGSTLARDRLTDALGTRGSIWDTVESYRRAVDERLFGLGHDRYEALVNLLIHLRQPQLSKRPNEHALSDALTRALRPIDAAVVADVAEAFRSLESERDELEGLTQARRSVDEFLDRYRVYAGTAARRHAAGVRTSHNEYDTTHRKLNEARQTFAEAKARAERVAMRLVDAGTELAAARATEATLREDPDARHLEQSAQRLRTAEEIVGRATAERDEAAQSLTLRVSAVEKAESAVEAAWQRVEAARDRLHQPAADAGLDDVHELVAGLLPGADPASMRAHVDSSIRRRHDGVTHMSRLLDELDRAHAELVDARRRLDEATSERDAAVERLGDAESVAAEAGHRLVRETVTFVTTCVELALDGDEVIALVEQWIGSVDGANPLTTAVAAAASVRTSQLAGKDARIAVALDTAHAAVRELDAERARLEAGEDLAPPVTHTRSSSRDGRDGVALWQSVDFDEQLDDVQRAGLEAALEASGLLDAWITPDGTLVDPETFDVMVSAQPSVPSNLGSWLHPAIDRGDVHAQRVADETLAAVLAGIGAGMCDSSTWVDVSGRWRNGVLDGAWTKPVAQYVGRGARDAARRQRIAEIDAEVASLRAEIDQREAAKSEVAHHRESLDTEVGSAPSDLALRDALARVDAITGEVHRAEDRVRTRTDHLAEVTRSHDDVITRTNEAAVDLALPAERGALDGIRQALIDLDRVLAGLWPAIERHEEHCQHLDAANTERDAAESTVARREEIARKANLSAAQARAEQETLQASIGAAVEKIQRRLAETTEAIRRLGTEETALRDEQLEATQHVGQAEGRAEELASQLTVVTDTRTRAITALWRFTGAGLLAVAVPDIEIPDATEPWAPDPAVRFARRVDQALSTTDETDSAWQRVQRQINGQFNALAESLTRFGHQASAEMTDEGFVVSVIFQGRACGVNELSLLLADEVAHRVQLLDARERELLENHLVNEAASHLQELVSEAEQQVTSMNAELAKRPTSTGMKLRFVWQPAEDGPPGLGEARRRLLRQRSDAWSADDREAVGAFLQQQIALVRAEREGGTWLEHLTIALDYRQWHRFRIERWQDGRWVRATGPASGGERVLAVTIPLFAAASSHYSSAHPDAPRLVLLDEAFAGVDDDSRAKSMGLLDTFDLDYVMTSEREWGCYPTVPGLAICHLARREGIDAVLVTRWEWDGRVRSRSDVTPLSPVTLADITGNEVDGNGAFL